ncbi:ligand-binding sensor domain-containing protein [Pedobacter duraquae]|uniref:Two component regulator with propeller domain n=1 Tax=Pedobacter duraquae TaxID=425511 RepID=A0A4R6IPF4_9SPHI|nr:two-component regulator propeller domain-containing protein [Pedobacter duraquae]TDO23815.1 two component regulator with propeller domain [Pedobacter duraquae]
MKYIHLYALFLMFLFCASCKGQAKTGVLNDTVSSQGPDKMVRNVKKGKDGSILIAASLAGIFRYDGRSFTNLTSNIGARRFWNVLEDRQGNVWCATTESGVYCYNGASVRHFTTKEGLPNNSVMSIYEDRAGTIWFGTRGGASRYDGKSFQNLTTKEGLSNNGVHTILEDKNGKFWFGTGGAACSYDGKTFTVFRNNEGKTFNNVWSIIEDRKGNIWFGASITDYKTGDTLFISPGLWRYDGNRFTKVTERAASAIMEDTKGNIWTTGSVSPNGVGDWILSRYDQSTLYDEKPAVTKITSIKKMLCGILEANDGSIWFGSINGVYRYDGKTIVRK